MAGMHSVLSKVMKSYKYLVSVGCISFVLIVTSCWCFVARFPSQ